MQESTETMAAAAVALQAHSGCSEAAAIATTAALAAVAASTATPATPPACTTGNGNGVSSQQRQRLPQQTRTQCH